MNGSLSLSVFFGVLQTLGIVLLWILAIIAVLVLLILLVPVRYQAEGAVEDPESHDEMDDAALESLKEHAHGTFSFRWLFGAVRGGIGWPENPVFMIRILAWKINVNEVLEKQKAKREEKEEERARAGREKRRRAGLAEKEENDGDSGKDPKEKRREKLRKLRTRLPEYRKFWNRKSTKRALHAVLEDGGGAIRRILPRDWSVTGTVGLGDPELAGDLMAFEGFLIPLTGEHLRVLPEFQKVQVDLAGRAEGRIRIVSLAAAALKLVLNQDVRKAVRFIREEKEYLVDRRAEDCM